MRVAGRRVQDPRRDGGDEFLTVAGNRLICVCGDRGPGPRLKWSVPLPATASQLTIADADNDGFLDILYTGSDGYVHCLGHSGPFSPIPTAWDPCPLARQVKEFRGLRSPRVLLDALPAPG
jgi:hypothetical protein